MLLWTVVFRWIWQIICTCNLQWSLCLRLIDAITVACSRRKIKIRQAHNLWKHPEVLRWSACHHWSLRCRRQLDRPVRLHIQYRLQQSHRVTCLRTREHAYVTHFVSRFYFHINIDIHIIILHVIVHIISHIISHINARISMHSMIRTITHIITRIESHAH